MEQVVLPEFRSFNKIQRLNRTCLVTEKLDGTNGVIWINPDNPTELHAGSRNRWLSEGADNYGFYIWVQQNKPELLKLGPGYHYGEWWGVGIQRGYALSERRFSLFNTDRWEDPAVRPACCHVVPIIARENLLDLDIKACLNLLSTQGSMAAPGYKNPEGIVVFHYPGRTMYKVTLDGDGNKGTVTSGQVSAGDGNKGSVVSGGV